MTLTRSQLVSLCERRDLGIVADAAGWHPEAKRLLAGVPPQAVEALRADGRRAIQELVEANMGLVGLVVQRHAAGRLAIRDELFQEGVVGLVTAAWSYDPEQSRFSTFAYHHVRGTVVTALLTNVGEHHLRTNQARDVMQVRRAEQELVTSGRQATASAIAQELGRPVDVVTEIMGYARHSTIPFEGADIADPADRAQKALDKVLEPDVARYVRMLPPLEREVIEKLHGMNGHEARIAGVLADELGTSRTSVSRIADSGYTHLRGLIDRDSYRPHSRAQTSGLITGAATTRRRPERHERAAQARSRPAPTARM